jgi:L-seryl-tRNA(Ser) seleniumtransferase
MADLRVIPAIEHLRQRDAMRALEDRYGRTALVDALRAETAALRDRLASGGLAAITVDEAIEEIQRGAEARLRAAMRPSLAGVINATGVIIHTNLGRAPLSDAAAARVAAIAAGYTNLEYDLAAGSRGRRDVHAERLLLRLTGAEAAVVVNNNAAATMLMLAALAAGREVIISRGELVEIGGGFRVPDVMAQSGALLREVGTTNRTRPADYAAAITDRTALILRVHPSNFRITGFTERPALDELVAIGRRFGVLVAEDLGSGWLGAREGEEIAPPLSDEPVVSASVDAGADVVTFSGDKLLGGPQAGIIAGRREPLDLIRRHPLMRALRVDKMTYAALEATLEQHAIGHAR